MSTDTIRHRGKGYEYDLEGKINSPEDRIRTILLDEKGRYVSSGIAVVTHRYD